MKSFANIFVKMISQAWNLSPHRIEEFTYKITIDDLSDNKKKNNMQSRLETRKKLFLLKI